ncbi:MAG TPA: gluconate 2-dehydrogenase subunit 3 family protein [Candidatus Binataceae bacterium]|nr:gluconate 2-dehydrogenase subunit 3 family protein [Candidatus Binataceae bacterium]
MKRREFLKRTALLATGAAAAASGLGVGLTAADPSPPTALDAHQQATLLAMTRQIYPHDRLATADYQKVVDELDAQAAQTPATAALLRDGVASLDSGGSTKFVDLSAEQQVAALKKIDTTPFFQKVQSTALVALYNNHDVWKKLGYPGPSYQIGGYIHHGFNDLSWLPNPPEFASPKPA